MWLTIVGPVGHREELAVDLSVRLGAVLEAERVFINGEEREDWREVIPSRGDQVEVWQGAAEPVSIGVGISAAVGGAISAATAATIVSTIYSVVLSLALSSIVRALTPKPKKPKLDSNHQEAFGVAGFQNTDGRGTPSFVPYGLNRIWGHVLSSGATLSPDGVQMYGRILLFVGDTGGDGIGSISDILIDGTSIAQYEEIQVHTRTGLDVQSVIPEL